MAEKVPKNSRLTHHCHCSCLLPVILYPRLEGPLTRDFASALLSCIDCSKNYPQVICLCSSPDVVQQAVTFLKRMKAKSFPSLTLTERVSRKEKITEHIVIECPWPVLDCANKKLCDPLKVEKIVIVGSDEFIDIQGLESPAIRISNKLHPSCQRVLYTASISDSVKEFAQKFFHNQDQQVLRPVESLLDSTQWYYVQCYGEESKFKAIAGLYGALDIGNIIIFCPTSIAARNLAVRMSKLGLPVDLVTDDLTAPQRVKVLRGFSDGKVRVLITAVALNGVYLGEVTFVVNYEIPLDSNGNFDCDTYLSRISHARRADKPGLVINFIDSQRSLENLKFVEGHFGKKIVSLDTEDLTDMQKIQS